MKSFFVIKFIAVGFAFSVNATAGDQSEQSAEDWQTVEIDNPDPGAQQSVTNQAVLYGLQELAVHVQHLETKCEAPDSGDCSAAIVAAEVKTKEVVKTSGLSPKARRQVRRMMDEAMTAANIGDIEGVRKIREQLADHEKRIAIVEGDVTKLKTDVTELKVKVKKIEDGGVTPQGSDNPERVSVVAQAAVDKANEALATAQAAQTMAEEAKAQTSGTEAMDRANEAKKKAEDALSRADQALDAALSPANDDHARDLARQAMDAAQSAAQSADDALLLARKVSKKLESDVAALKTAVDKKQDANEVEIGNGYFTTGKIYAPTVGVAYTVRRGKVRLAIGADFGYHFFYDDIEYDPEIRILFNSYFRLGYQFTDWFAAGLGAFSYSAGQPYSDTFGFGAELSARFSWRVTEALGMAVELWGGPTYEWRKVTNPEPAGTMSDEIYKAVDQEGGASGAGGIRMTFTF
ncbi:MAG: hypothetical protein NTW66_04585 [Candidatus Magasanikbacteria bacterium]|nr:hypothetical protein [Candidatus Magasanikbacteria bacterium]